MSLFGIAFLFLLRLNCLFGQKPDTIWAKTYGGSNYEFCCSVVLTGDNCYILGAQTQSRGAGSFDFWLIKTDLNGDTIWTKTYGGVRDDECRGVLQTTDGGYLLIGSSKTFSNPPYYPDIYVVKTDSLGDSIWTKKFGGQVADVSYGALQTTDGGYIIVGSTWSYGPSSQNGYIIKLNSLGDTLWTKVYGGAYEDLFSAVQQTPDRGYIVCGQTASFGAGNYDAWLLKTDSLGDTLWTKTFGGSSWDYGMCLDQTADGGYVISGTTNMGTSSPDIWLIKCDADGNIQWLKTYDVAGVEFGRTIHQLDCGGYIIGGYKESPPGSGYTDAYLVRTDVNGDTLWTNAFGYHGYYDDILSLQVMPDNGYIAVGSTNAYGAGLSDVWLLKFDADTFGAREAIKKSQLTRNMTISPNPFRTSTNIYTGQKVEGEIGIRDEGSGISIYDVAGKLVKILSLPTSNFQLPTSVCWNGTDQNGRPVPPGVYFIQLKVNHKQTAINKIIKIK